MKEAAKYSPLVQAMLAGTPKTTRSGLGDRIVDTAVDGLTAVTHAVGQLSVAADTVHFSDGAKKQKLRSISQRTKYWEDIGAQYGLTNAELAAVIAS